jgi:exopolysaccharide biosynthesis WecB/TagA/CpsF family protein
MDQAYLLDDYTLDEFVPVATNFGHDRFGYVVTPNVDHLIRYYEDPAFRSSYEEAAYVLLDSRVLSYAFRVTKGISTKVCTGSDLTARLFHTVIQPTDPIVLIGGGEAQVRHLTERFGLMNLRHYNPPMGFVHDQESVDACARFIEANSPFRFCFFAVGAPQQEILARRVKERGIARGLGFCVGASINFLTGQELRAPRWMQRIGTEWLFRLIMNPDRMASRYLVRGPRVLPLIVRTHLRLRAAAKVLPAIVPAPAVSPALTPTPTLTPAAAPKLVLVTGSRAQSR